MSPEAFPLNWKLADIKGTLSPGYTEEDLVSCFKYDLMGNKFACGDRGGRVVVFERDHFGTYDFLSSFQSHEDMFDSLRSISIDKRINAIEWLNNSNASNMFMTTNDRVMKLWKIERRPPKCYENFSSINKMNKITKDYKITTNCKHEFKDGHSFHINSISMNSDQQTFLSSDELRINIWDLNVTGVSFICVDLKPENLSDCTELIHVTKFHPKHCNLFAYSLNTGSIKLCDMRQKAHCDFEAISFDDKEPMYKNSDLFSFLKPVTALQFSSDGNYILGRDFMNLKVYDVRSNKCPVETYNIHEHLDTRLHTIVHSELISEIYDVNFSGDDRYIIAGSFSTFRMVDRYSKTEYTYDLSHAKLSRTTGYFTPKKVTNRGARYRRPRVSDEVIFRNIDLNKRTQTIWNPKHNEIVVSCTKNLYLFRETPLNSSDK